jgi:hypothetical protein
VRELRTEAGYQDVRLDAMRAPMYFGRDVEDTWPFVSAQAAGMFRGLDETATARALDELRASLAEHQTEQGVCYGAAAWLIQARRDCP